MKQDDTSRRGFLRRVATIIPASTLTPAILMQQGCTRTKSEPGEGVPGTGPMQAGGKYRPIFFTTAEWNFIQASVDELIPSDGTGAGALEAGVPEFIDRQMETPYGHGRLWYMQAPFHPESAPELGYQSRLVPREIYRLGIEACNAWCKQNHGRPFDALARETRVQVLEHLEAGAIQFNEVPAKLFFSTLLKNTKEGYFADPMYGGNRGMAGWKMIGFPGARGDFFDWVEQPGAKYPLGPVSILGEQA